MATDKNQSIPKEPSANPNKEARVIRLGQVDYVPANVLESYLIIPWNRKGGTATLRGSELLADSSEHQGEGRSPTQCLFVNAKNNPKDVLAVLSNEKTDDTVKVEWRNQGQNAVIDMAKILTHLGTAIPKGTRMFIELYEDNDPDWGQVVGLRINSPEFRPIDYLTEEEKEERARKKAEKEQAKKDAKSKPQEQAVAEQPAAEAAESEDEAE